MTSLERMKHITLEAESLSAGSRNLPLRRCFNAVVASEPGARPVWFSMIKTIIRGSGNLKEKIQKTIEQDKKANPGGSLFQSVLTCLNQKVVSSAMKEAVRKLRDLRGDQWILVAPSSPESTYQVWFEQDRNYVVVVRKDHFMPIAEKDCDVVTSVHFKISKKAPHFVKKIVAFVAPLSPKCNPATENTTFEPFRTEYTPKQVREMTTTTGTEESLESLNAKDAARNVFLFSIDGKKPLGKNATDAQKLAVIDAIRKKCNKYSQK